MNWKETFLYQGKPLYYNRIEYNNIAERAVEIPVAFDYLARLKNKTKLLEIGNVLSNYENTLSDVLGIRPRRIIDKFEVAPGIENIDLMDLSAQEKFDAIISISTVEHINQGYKGNQENHDLEAPLKAIAKIYDLLEPDGKALITVPFGKLLDGGWYIHFSYDYLQLLISKYNIPEAAISTHYLKRILTELEADHPRQLWIETPAEALQDTDYGWLWPYGNGLAVIELTKVSDQYTLNLDVEATPMEFGQAAIDTLSQDFIQSTYAILTHTREINLIAFPDWQASDRSIDQAFNAIISAIAKHPDQSKISVFIHADDASEENAGLTISAALMNLLMETNISPSQVPSLHLLKNLDQMQWQAILSLVQCRIGLKIDNSVAIAQVQAQSIPTCPISKLSKFRAVELETGLWEFQSSTIKPRK